MALLYLKKLFIMKIKHYFLLCVFTLFSLGLNAQSNVGTVDTDLILSKMPEFKQVQDDAQKYNAELEKDLQGKITTYQEKVADYQKNLETYSDVLKKTKEDEILKLETEIQQFRQNGTQLIQIKQQDLLRPLYEKMAKAIEEVAQANKYTQILNLGGAELAYFDPNHDITKKVMAKLGIKE